MPADLSPADLKLVKRALYLLRDYVFAAGTKAPELRIVDGAIEALSAARADGLGGGDWTPSAENINALPDPLRRYIHDLKTNVDPAGMVLENHQLREQTKAVEAMYLAIARPPEPES